MLALFRSFFNCLQGLVVRQSQIFESQKSIGLNSTFHQNAILSLMKIERSIRSLPVKEMSNSVTL